MAVATYSLNISRNFILTKSVKLFITWKSLSPTHSEFESVQLNEELINRIFKNLILAAVSFKLSKKHQTLYQEYCY